MDKQSGEPAELGNILLRIGASLLHAGAGSTRVTKNLKRIAEAYGYEAHPDLGTRTISLTLDRKHRDEHAFTGSRSISSMPGVDFTVISGISKLSWDVVEKPVPLDELRNAFSKVMKSIRYPRNVELGLVGLAGISLCYTFGGTWMEMGATLVATISGLFVRQKMLRMKYNSYLVTFCGAAWATLVVSLISKMLPAIGFEHAFATSILFLIPGVPLIMSFIDLMDGYIINAIDRGVYAFVHAFAIALGLSFILYIFNIA